MHERDRGCSAGPRGDGTRRGPDTGGSPDATAALPAAAESAPTGGPRVPDPHRPPVAAGHDRPLAVTLLLGAEVLRRGVASLLEQLPHVTLTGSATGPGDPGPPPWAAEVVIASLPEWRRLADEGYAEGRPPPVVVLIGDDIRARDLSFPTAPPCDGVVSLAEATVAVLDDALRRAVRGEFPLPGRLARELVAGGRGPGRRREGRPVSFTERETETLGLLIEGYSNKQIAKALGISAHGVKRLVGAILLKLDAPNRTTAAVMAMDQRLV